MLKSDLLTVMQAVSDGKLADCPVEFKEGSACCVIMASNGYPVSYEKGFEISIPDDLSDNVYVAGASLKEGKLLTNGGRVLGVTAVEDDLAAAVKTAYSYVGRIAFDNAYFRHDIGARALKALEE